MTLDGDATPRLPDFLVIGARKCGTVWINHCLRDHPCLHLPTAVHETMFFDRHYGRGASWYARYFAGHGGSERVGEVAPTYLEDPAVPGRVRKLLPEATLLASLRNPVERARSMYLHHWRKGDIPAGLDFRSACARIPGILEGSAYARNLNRWLDHFPREKLHVFVLEDSYPDPCRYISGIYQALGVDAAFSAPSACQRFNEHQVPRSLLLSRLGHGAVRTLHRRGLHGAVEAAKKLGAPSLVFGSGTEGSSEAPSLAAEDRSWLVERFIDDVRTLTTLLGRDLRLWGDFADQD